MMFYFFGGDFVLQNNELLHDACKEGIDLSFLEVLLSISSSLCDVNGRDKHGRTGLHTACASSSKVCMNF